MVIQPQSLFKEISFMKLLLFVNQAIIPLNYNDIAFVGKNVSGEILGLFAFQSLASLKLLIRILPI